MPFGERYIWGVTAGILRNLYEDLRIYAPMIRPVLTEIALFLAPFVRLRHFLWRPRSAMLQPASWPPQGRWPSLGIWRWC